MQRATAFLVGVLALGAATADADDRRGVPVLMVQLCTGVRRSAKTDQRRSVNLARSRRFHAQPWRPAHISIPVSGVWFARLASALVPHFEV